MLECVLCFETFSELCVISHYILRKIVIFIFKVLRLIFAIMRHVCYILRYSLWKLFFAEMVVIFILGRIIYYVKETGERTRDRAVGCSMG